MGTGTDSGLLPARYAGIRQRSGLSKKGFAESLGIHPVVSGDIELGKREPSRDVLVRLARVYGVDINWLLTGERAAPDREESGDREDFAEIEYVRQEAAAGRGAEIDEYAEVGRIPVLRSFIAPYRPERVRAVAVRGDSMTGAGIADGDLVFYAPGERAAGGIQVVSLGSQLLVKRVELDQEGKTVRLLSENPRYPARLLAGADLEEFRIEGRVIGWMHRA